MAVWLVLRLLFLGTTGLAVVAGIKITFFAIFAGFQHQWNMLKGIQLILMVLVGIQCPVLKKKIAKTSKNYQFLTQLVQKCGPYGPHPKQKTFFLFAEITKPYHKLCFQKLYFIKISCFGWVKSYEYFSIFCDSFLLKSIISPAVTHTHTHAHTHTHTHCYLHSK